MLFLLTDCSVFVNLPGGNNLLQICGKPLSEERVKVPAFSSVPIKQPKPISYINRSRILYGRPICPTNPKVIGLPFKRTYKMAYLRIILFCRRFEFERD